VNISSSRAHKIEQCTVPQCSADTASLEYVAADAGTHHHSARGSFPELKGKLNLSGGGPNVCHMTVIVLDIL